MPHATRVIEEAEAYALAERATTKALCRWMKLKGSDLEAWLSNDTERSKIGFKETSGLYVERMDNLLTEGDLYRRAMGFFDATKVRFCDNQWEAELINLSNQLGALLDELDLEPVFDRFAGLDKKRLLAQALALLKGRRNLRKHLA